MDFRQRSNVVRSHLLLIASAVAAATIITLAVSLILPPVYEAKTTLVVGQALSAVNPDLNQLLASGRLSQTYAEVVTTRPILEKVIAETGLKIDPTKLAERVSVDVPKDSTLLHISAQDSDPVLAAAIANALAKELIAASPSVQGRSDDILRFVDSDLRSIQQQVSDTQAQIDALVALPTRTGPEEDRLQILQGRLVQLRSSYATLLSYASNSSANLLSVVDPAVRPEAPSSPRVLLNTALGAIVGLLLAIGLALILDRVNDAVKSADDVLELTGLPTLGRISTRRGEGERSAIYSLISLTQPRSPGAEGFRALRTNLEFANPDDPVHTILVTSAIAGEGKTTVASNLAVVFAQAGRKTLLVDADLRNPGIHQLFGLPNEYGLSDLLRLNVPPPIGRVTTSTQDPNLRVITSGLIPPNPAELLGSRRMQMLMDQFREAADIVIIDSPPVVAVTDAAVLSTRVDGTVLVIQAGRTRRQLARRGSDAIASVGSRVLGVVLNRVPEAREAMYPYELPQPEAPAAPVADSASTSVRGT